MKNIRGFLLADLIIVLIKCFFGYLLYSNALIISGFYECIIILFLLFSISKKNNVFKSIITLIVSGGLLGVSGYRLFILGRVFISKIKVGLTTDLINIPSLWLILILLLILIIRYIVQCIVTTKAFNKHGGLLSIGNIRSNYDFYMLGIVLLSTILGNLGRIKSLNFLLYSIIIAEILVLGFVIYKLIVLFINSIKSFSKEFLVPDSYHNEITSRKEVRRLSSINISSFGGIRISKVNLEINNISMIDINSFVLTLQDYMLKISDVTEIWLGSSDNSYSNAIQRRLNNARNSGSRNSSSNSKGKNNRKKNKKR